MEKNKEYYESLDKRTNEFKDWKASQKIEAPIKTQEELLDKHGNLPNGLGDTIEKVFKATGVDKVAKFLLGEDCNCEERKEKINKIPLFRYHKPLCLTENEYMILDDILNRTHIKNGGVMQVAEQKQLLIIRKRIFQRPKDPTSCSTCGASLVNELRKVYETYK